MRFNYTRQTTTSDHLIKNILNNAYIYISQNKVVSIANYTFVILHTKVMIDRGYTTIESYLFYHDDEFIFSS